MNVFGEESVYYRSPAPASTEAERRSWWDAASGLQAVDGLTVPDYAYGNAERYIRGEIGSAEAVANVEREYPAGGSDPSEREAAVVATRIVQVLEEAVFELSARKLASIHARLFDGVLGGASAGRFRDYDIYKPEPVLGGRTVRYAPHAEIRASLEYDMENERATERRAPFGEGDLPGFTRFVAGVWQVHPFGEGNTRTCATFAALYLRRLGVEADSAPFLENSVLFRDALVRASYEDPAAGVSRDFGYLEAFFRKVALDPSLDLAGLDLNVRGTRPREDDYEFVPEGAGMAYRGPYPGVGPGRGQGRRHP